MKFVLGRVENIVGKRENAGNQHFLCFPQCFQKLSSPGWLKVSVIPAFSPLSTMSSKVPFFKVEKSQDCVGLC